MCVCWRIGWGTAIRHLPCELTRTSLIITDTAGRSFLENFGMRLTGTVNVSMLGTYFFNLLQLDDQARIVVDAAVIFNGNGPGPQAGAIALTFRSLEENSVHDVWALLRRARDSLPPVTTDWYAGVYVYHRCPTAPSVCLAEKR